MRKFIVYTLFSLLFFVPHTIAQTGRWKVFAAYSDITEVEKVGHTLYVLASEGLYAYNTNDQSVQTFDKTNGLSDVKIAHIAWCQAAKTLVVAYQNQNIDLLKPNGEVTNLSDYHRKNMLADKTIYAIYIAGTDAYLSTGFGIVKLNVKKGEVSDTYQLGFRVDWTHIEGGVLYAESADRGKYSAPLTAHLADKSSWTRVGSFTPNPHLQPDAALKAEASKAHPGGPKYNHFYYLKHTAGRLYSVGGAYASGGVQMGYPGAVQVLENGDWTLYQEDVENTTGYDFKDINCLAVDPKDAHHVFVGGRPGLYEFQDGKLKAFYNKDNSLLKPAIDRGRELNNNYVIVNAMAFDAAGNLWLANSQTRDRSLLSIPHHGTMQNHHKSELMNEGLSLHNMTQMMTDSRGWIWFCNAHWKRPALVCYRPATDEIKVYSAFYNQDGNKLEVRHITCVAEDLEGHLWVGTDVAPLYLAVKNGQPADVFTQFKIPRNDGTNSADYLLNEVGIKSVAIDGANRKWLGTESDGAYLIGADNMTQIHHFKAENSQLIDNTILNIAIDNRTGEVFFATEKGLCSYAGDATTASNGSERDVYAYPNPVPPDYSGLIHITGLTYNAHIKITTSNGVLVKEGRSNGGLFTWDGTDMSGKRVASGVYMVLEATAEGSKGVVCKVAIVN